MTLDIILLVLLAVATYSGWRSGAVAMVISVLVLVVAVILASALAARVGALVHIGSPWAWPIVGFVFTFLVLVILGSWLRRFFRPKHGLLRSMDGLFGAVLGFARGAIVLALLAALFDLIHLPPERMTQGSHIYPVLLKISTMLIAVLRPYITAPGAQSGLPV